MFSIRDMRRVERMYMWGNKGEMEMGGKLVYTSPLTHYEVFFFLLCMVSDKGTCLFWVGIILKCVAYCLQLASMKNENRFIFFPKIVRDSLDGLL